MSQSAAVGDGMGRLANTAKLATRMKIARYLNMPVYLIFIVLPSNLVMTSASLTVYWLASNLKRYFFHFSLG
jgi:hypothetical protein